MNRRLTWLAGLVVAIGAAAATAHGLYEVAVASRVPAGIAWLYPVITDGLALVAYAATRQLKTGVWYAWAIVVLAAGLSGIAQAVLLATDPATTPPLILDGEEVSILTAPAPVRFGIGAWPAVAAAIVAHLLYLLGRTEPDIEETTEDLVAGADVPAAPAADLELADTDPYGWWPAAPQLEERGGDEPGAAELVTASGQQHDTALAFEVRMLVADYEARGEQPPGRRKLAARFGTTEHRIRTILDDREAART